MAKNKATRVPKPSKNMPTQPQEEDCDPEQPQMPMDDSAVKFQTLKSLNERLVKETHQRRKEVGALVQAKEALETDLTRNIKEKKQVIGELTEAREQICALELGKNVVSTFLQTQMKAEMSEVILKLEEETDRWRRVCSERDEVQVAFDGLLEEANNLRVRLHQMETNERMASEEIQSLKEKSQKLMIENQENQMTNGTLLKENETLKKRLDDSVGVIGDLEKEMELKMNEKVGIEREKNGLEMVIEKLQRQVAEMSESALNFTKEKKESDERISELEKRIGEAMEKEDGMIMEIGCLVKELDKKDKGMGMVTQQRDSLELKLNLIREEVENLQRTIEVISSDKVGLDEAKMEAESIIIDLHSESSKLKEAIASLSESSDAEKARNEEFLSEIRRLQDSLDEVSIERDDARKSFIQEKKSTEKLSLLLTEKEKMVEEAMDELRKAKIAQKDAVNVLVGERDSMEQKLLEAQSRTDDLEAKMKTVAANSVKVLALVKQTCWVVCDGDGSKKKGEEGKAGCEQKQKKVEEEVEEHVEAIKRAFMKKQKVVEEMKQLLEAAEAKEKEQKKKKKSFFTIVTAATTILAAAVYASRGR